MTRREWTLAGLVLLTVMLAALGVWLFTEGDNGPSESAEWNKLCREHGGLGHIDGPIIGVCRDGTAVQRD